jgi:hypothetical protein
LAPFPLQLQIGDLAPALFGAAVSGFPKRLSDAFSVELSTEFLTYLNLKADLDEDEPGAAILPRIPPPAALSATR